MRTTPQATPMVDIRRVSIQSADPVTGEVMVRDTNGWQGTVLGTTRPKGTGFPAVGEIWVLRRQGPTWLLASQVGAKAPPIVTGSRAASDGVALSLLAALVDLGLVRDGTVPGAVIPPGGTDVGAIAATFSFGTSEVWDIYHDLGYNPSVTTVDATGDVVEGDVQYLSITHIQVSFSPPMAGTAYLS